MAKSTRKREFHTCGVFSIRALLWERNVMSNVNFLLSGNSKDQLGDLNQKLITTTNNLDGSTLGVNLVTSQQVDYMLTALIPAEPVENNQEHLVANKVGSIMSLV